MEEGCVIAGVPSVRDSEGTAPARLPVRQKMCRPPVGRCPRCTPASGGCGCFAGIVGLVARKCRRPGNCDDSNREQIGAAASCCHECDPEWVPPEARLTCRPPVGPCRRCTPASRGCGCLAAIVRVAVTVLPQEKRDDSNHKQIGAARFGCHLCEPLWVPSEIH